MFAKKSLGQNFLISTQPVRRMIECAKVIASDTVLEIGPGKGVLTKALLATGARVIAVEKDDNLIPLLQVSFDAEIRTGQFTLIHGDVLTLFATHPALLTKGYKVVANIPYYITGEIIRMFLEAEIQPDTIALLVQKEVAERIVARDGKESILSISVKAYGVPEYGGTVKKSLFRPIPNVDSAIIAIHHITKALFVDKQVSELRFFEVVKAGFAHKRKQLKNNLKGVIDDTKLESVGMRRAEELTVQEWIELSA
ncbi:MAG: dimethyladenosine transferase, rRNA (adenine1518-N6/adenine1519-N6)-dimethyltransferase [Candidatus Parcubacteria bacterium]